MKFIKKPVVINSVQIIGRNMESKNELLESGIIDAVQFTGKNMKDINELLDGVSNNKVFDFNKHIITINISGNEMNVSKGDYIIKGINGQFYLRKPDVFEMEYEVVCDIEDLRTV